MSDSSKRKLIREFGEAIEDNCRGKRGKFSLKESWQKMFLDFSRSTWAYSSSLLGGNGKAFNNTFPAPSLDNECSYEGCLNIIQEYIEWVNNWYRKAGRGIIYIDRVFTTKCALSFKNFF